MTHIVITTSEGNPVGVIQNKDSENFCSLKVALKCISDFEGTDVSIPMNIEGDMYNGIQLETQEDTYTLKSTHLYEDTI